MTRHIKALFTQWIQSPQKPLVDLNILGKNSPLKIRSPLIPLQRNEKVQRARSHLRLSRHALPSQYVFECFGNILQDCAVAKGEELKLISLCTKHTLLEFRYFDSQTHPTAVFFPNSRHLRAETQRNWRPQGVRPSKVLRCSVGG